MECKNIAVQTKRMYKQKNNKSWQTFCNGLNANTNISSVWRRAKAIKNGLSQNIKTPISTEKTENLMHKLAPDSTNQDFPVAEQIKHHFLSSDVSMEELEVNIHARHLE